MFSSNFEVQNEKITILRNFSQSQFDFESGVAISQLTQFDFHISFFEK